MQPISFPVINRNPEREYLGAAIWAPWPKWGFLRLWQLLDQTKHFARGRLIKARANPGFPDGLQQSHRARCGDIAGVFRAVETHPDMALCRQVINLFGLDF